MEAIRPGTLLQTRDGGLQPVLWAGGGQVPWRPGTGSAPYTLLPCPGLTGRLERPLTLSAHHRVLLSGPALDMHFALDEAFAPASGLGVAAPGPGGWQDWHHVLLPDHHAICANGVWVESLLAGPGALDVLPASLAGEVRAAAGPDAARTPCRPWISQREARLLAAPARRAA